MEHYNNINNIDTYNDLFGNASFGGGGSRSRSRSSSRSRSKSRDRYSPGIKDYGHNFNPDFRRNHSVNGKVIAGAIVAGSSRGPVGASLAGTGAAISSHTSTPNPNYGGGKYLGGHNDR